MNITIRPAALADTRQMAELLAEIVEAGGAKAKTDTIKAQNVADWMDTNGAASAWFVAEDDEGNILGFQWIKPKDTLPPEACDIATFVKLGATNLGIGSRLFEATADASRRLGYAWINAELRADNFSGQPYYQSRGFRDWSEILGVTLGDGTVVANRLMRFDLD